MIRRLSLFLAVSFALLQTATLSAQDQDTLRFTSADAEAYFLKNNLPLLAERLNINQAEAKILQAKAWPNPTFTLDELQLYKNSTTDNIPPLFGDFWRDRNFAMQIEQLVYTAGKRRKNIALETQNKELAEMLFMDLLQALRTELRQTVSEIRYLQTVQRSWQIQVHEITRLLNAQESQRKAGYTSQAELFRLKALYISLKSEITALGETMSENQKTLKTLMYVDPKSYIVITDSVSTETITGLKSKTLNELVAMSAENPRMRAAQHQVKISETQLAIERANRVPDVNLIANYDRNGSTMRNFLGVGASMDLPVFNRNKGNIRAARYEVEKTTLLQKNTASELTNAIVKHWTDLNESIRFYDAIDKDYIEKLDQMTVAIGRNFSEHNISLLQFLDYYESFRESKERYYNIVNNIVQQKEELNYLIGSDL